MPIFSWSALVFGSTATSLTGGKLLGIHLSFWLILIGVHAMAIPMVLAGLDSFNNRIVAARERALRLVAEGDAVSEEHRREHAEGIVRRHRLIERFLTDVLGIPWDDVHEEAERLEHAMSPKLEARHLRLRAIVYVRQSTPRQVQVNAESTRRQYQLALIKATEGAAAANRELRRRPRSCSRRTR